MKAARKAAEEQRSGEVAQIRFAEDDADDFIDAAGMDAAVGQEFFQRQACHFESLRTALGPIRVTLRAGWRPPPVPPGGG